jgi:apolipoprotein N-acyltransferase
LHAITSTESTNPGDKIADKFAFNASSVISCTEPNTANCITNFGTNCTANWPTNYPTNCAESGTSAGKPIQSGTSAGKPIQSGTSAGDCLEWNNLHAFGLGKAKLAVVRAVIKRTLDGASCKGGPMAQALFKGPACDFLARFFRWLAIDQSALWQPHKPRKMHPFRMMAVGAFGALGWAPFSCASLYVVAALALFVRLAGCQTRWQGFWSGWSWAFGLHLVGLSWVGHALLVDANRFAWLMPVAVLGLPAVVAIYTGVVGALVCGWRPRRSNAAWGLPPVSGSRCADPLCSGSRCSDPRCSGSLVEHSSHPFNAQAPDAKPGGGLPFSSRHPLLTDGLLSSRTTFRFSLALACSLSAAEVIQRYFLTGFPWNLIGYTWGNHPGVAIWACVLGSYGLGLVSLLMAAWLFSGVFLVLLRGCLRPLVMCILHCVVGAMALSVTGELFLMPSSSFLESGSKEGGAPSNSRPLLRLVQPATPQRQSLDIRYADQRVQALLHLSVRDNPRTQGRAPTHVIWPEDGFPWALSSQQRGTLAGAFDQKNPPVLLLGALYRGDFGAVYNALVVQVPGGLLEFAYGKRHLVPFGEYVPGRRFLQRIVPRAWLQKISPGSSDFTPGPQSQAVKIAGLPPVRVLICYEGIFPDIVRSYGRNELCPQWILTITNDGWFGTSSGPYQHLVSARFRAIEEGLPVVRAAKTGVSAVIDCAGRILNQLEVGKVGFIDTPLPPARKKRTLISRVSNVGMWGLLMAGLVSCQLIAHLVTQRRQGLYFKAKGGVGKIV